MNGETKRPIELYSMALDHKLYVVEGIRLIPSSIALIYLSYNIFDERFGENFVVLLYCRALHSKCTRFHQDSRKYSIILDFIKESAHFRPISVDFCSKFYF